jgi:DNA-binding Lrp family transcriptional regulator
MIAGGQSVFKKLRSLIHERFSLELRIELEKLSRQRSLTNKGKQDRLIKLLREHDIKDIVQLGSGTNRYGFKLDGFVIKFATDKHGRIDNFKEFKMAKRLYPHVIKVYEVSENGTMMVCEYIEPFSTFAEMSWYQDKIKQILSDMSSTYLIGDVGISENNFGNWGVRVGTKEPVCLDFAYVYDVSSELFMCSSCNTNSMLVPDPLFNKLFCPACKAGKPFSEVRSKIGHEQHQKEIGNLGDEGYVLTESNVITELTTERSNYLLRKEKKKQKKEAEESEPFVDDFVMPYSLTGIT